VKLKAQGGGFSGANHKKHGGCKGEHVEHGSAGGVSLSAEKIKR